LTIEKIFANVKHGGGIITRSYSHGLHGFTWKQA
jgi:hypothetical protein